MPYYRAEHRDTRKVWRIEARSKTQLRRQLARFDGSEYRSFWNLTEVDSTEWNRLKRQGVDFVPYEMMSRQ